MDEEEVALLIVELREVLEERGFEWLVDQVISSLPSSDSDTHLAIALVDAVEAVTVDLAKAELFAMRTLKVDEILFKPGPNAQSEEGDDQTLVEIATSRATFDYERLRGEERNAVLRNITEAAKTFRDLKERLNGNR